MRVALLFPNNLFTSPYLKYYESVLKKGNIDYDLYIWDRHGVNEKGCIAYTNKVKTSIPLFKSLDFIKFRRFLMNHLRKTEYNRIIVFSGQLGILMSDFLINNFPNKYILDIRDYSQVMSYFKSRFEKVIQNSYFVCVSSNGFKEWLPQNANYILGHNIDIALVSKSLDNFPFRDANLENETLKIDTIGQIKDFNSDARFIDQLKNDKRFKMEFIGFGPALNDLKIKSTSEKINNISFYGLYKKEEEPLLLKNTDIINILISRTEHNKGATLLSNRLYLSALYNIPCIVNSDTEQSRIIEKYNFGIIVDNYEELPNKLVAYKENFCKESFLNNCYTFLADVKKDYSLFEQKLTNFLIDK
ncbi:hypothetical protein H4O18_07685 [Arenibacter sp. BSSL-BM3]|uniref:Uncharacterized protein n=1 Tax=Arenibacter arenosicollis TaxID=2762274 RepID=A0ABR7QKZ9_9FLAO|nr:hypothetical protein [Arenibacter arenosicollis]MBC8767868.1 hypothetical protein [Arenibacter arenosicollis]